MISLLLRVQVTYFRDSTLT